MSASRPESFNKLFMQLKEVNLSLSTLLNKLKQNTLACCLIIATGRFWHVNEGLNQGQLPTQYSASTAAQSNHFCQLSKWTEA
jgi:hypothetical protein